MKKSLEHKAAFSRRLPELAQQLANQIRILFENVSVAV